MNSKTAKKKERADMRSEKTLQHFDAQKKTSNRSERGKEREGGPKYGGRGKKLARRSSTNDVSGGENEGEMTCLEQTNSPAKKDGTTGKSPKSCLCEEKCLDTGKREEKTVC